MCLMWNRQGRHSGEFSDVSTAESAKLGLLVALEGELCPLLHLLNLDKLFIIA